MPQKILGKMGTKVVLEVKEKNQFITENEIRAIRNLDEVIYVNRLTSNAVNFNPVTNSDSEEENNWKVTLLSYDDLERDSAFSDLRYRLMKGNMITEDSEVLYKQGMKCYNKVITGMANEI